MEKFNPNDPGVANGGYFALPWSMEEAEIALVSVPWDVTTSYRPGTSAGPQAMIEASTQIDLFDTDVPNAWDIKIATLPVDNALEESNAKTRTLAERVIEAWEEGTDALAMTSELNQINAACEEMNQYVYNSVGKLMNQGKTVGLVGGEHSVPLGYIRALAERYPNFGILHIDAHADLREAFEGFKYSHASIMFNSIQLQSVSKLVQVGIRDFCTDEQEIINSNPKVCAFTDRQISEKLFTGTCWDTICNQIIESLPENVHISFDIDGLDPSLCPNTGTPVPGGLQWSQAEYLLRKLALSSKRIIGFDLCEVSPGNSTDEWDSNVGSRLLYRLCCFTHLNHR